VTPSSADMPDASPTEPITTPADEPPIVLVPGFLGNETHWHLQRLRRRHPQRYIPMSPGPMSSHHDRACEIFYALKGGQCDYGEAHSSRCGHGRFGRLEDGAYPEWDEERPIDLVGHSVGGVTLRVLVQLLAERAFPGHRTSATWVRSVTTLASPHNGDPVVYNLGIPAATVMQAGESTPPRRIEALSPRRSAATAAPSAIYELCAAPAPSAQLVRRPRTSIGHADASSVTPSPSVSGVSPAPAPAVSPAPAPAPLPSASLAAHAPRLDVRMFSAGWALTLFIHLVCWLDLPILNSMVELRLEHWQLSRKVNMLSSLSTLMRALRWQASIGQSVDNAAYEVQPAATQRINAASPLRRELVYVSFTARRAPLAALGHALHEPRLLLRVLGLLRELLVLCFSFAIRFGGASSRRTACEHLGYDPEEWDEHDGLLSVRGQRAPLGEPTTALPHHLAASAASKEDGHTARPPPTPSTLEVMYGATPPPPPPRRRRPPLKRGVWHVHDLSMDHFAVCGGPLASFRCVDEFWDLYERVRRDFPRA